MIKRGRPRWFNGGDRGWIFLQDSRSDADLALALEGALAGEHFVKHGAERENIATAVQLFALDLLRGHVLECADDSALLGHGRLLRRRARQRG